MGTSALGRPVQLHVYANRIQILQTVIVVAGHESWFGRGKSCCDPWHYMPILKRKSGALHNGVPFKELCLPPALTIIRCYFAKLPDGDHQMGDVLLAAHEHEFKAREEARAAALIVRLRSAAAVWNITIHRGNYHLLDKTSMIINS